MSMGKREDERQSDLWLVTSDLAQSPGHPFYEPDQECPADATDPVANRQNFLNQNENRQSCNPEQVHHAAQEQQAHQYPAAPQAVSSVLQPHLDSALPARAPMTH